MTYRYCCIPLVLSLANLTSTLALAGNVYQFKDAEGNVLLTNVVDANKKPSGNRFKEYKTKVKVTYYPDSNIHTYKDWGATNRDVAPSQNRNKNAFDRLILDASQRNGVSASLVKAIMHTESGFNPNARSPVGAMGLMQLMPATAKRFGVSSPYDPAQNINGACKYLAYLQRKYQGNLEKMLAGYNAGEGNVDKYGGIPPFAETQDYVPRVLKRYHSLYKNTLSLEDQSNSSSSHRSINFQATAPTVSSVTESESDAAYTQDAISALRK
jgi:hypothetical protein